ncbi:MAG TPA: response regulator transcription factor [Sedimentisphaerales bacterium]|nr:response regulator transcription factor [Sedimentisphaerales bacterium]
MSTRILLVDDHKITRQGLRSLLENEQDMEVVAEAEEGRTAVRLVRELLPDVVIMDVSMPDLNGMEAARQIVGESADVKIIALSMHSDALFVTEMLKSGASGYLLKDCAFEELARAIRTVAADKTYLSPSISGVVVNDYVHLLSKGESVDAEVLSSREREVLQLLAEGKSTKQIALRLHISAKTVETHRRQIMEKLDIHSVAELTKYAIRKGFTSLEP